MLATDYRHVVDSLRTKANDKAVGPEERDALNAKADEIEKRHLNNKSTLYVASGPQPYITGMRVQYSYRRGEEWVTKTYEFPDDWYNTMDEWWNYESGSMAE